jgi:hypothetical protein
VFAATAEALDVAMPMQPRICARPLRTGYHTGITRCLDAGIGLKEMQSLSHRRALQALGPDTHADRDALFAQVAGCQGLVRA